MLTHVNVYQSGDKEGPMDMTSFVFSNAFNFPIVQGRKDE